MLASIEFQKQMLQRVIRLHALRSRAEHFEALQLSLDDPFIFELGYLQIMEILYDDEDEEFEVQRDPNGQVIAAASDLFQWFCRSRSLIIDQVHCVLESLGGIEIATFLSSADEALQLENAEVIS